MESRNDIAKQLHTLRDYLRWAVSQFTRAKLAYGHGTDNAYDEALHLLCHALTLPLDGDARLLDAKLTMEERQLVLVLLETRIKERIPVPYLTGEAWFAGLPFKVDERVLIPRSPIAELIEHGFQPWLGETEPARILDLCTGSGCIGIACALAFPEAEVVLSDLSEDALAVAAQNIERHGVGDRVRAERADLFEGLEGGFDLIVSNPPYVDAHDLAAMPPEYGHEPRGALAAGDDGLDLARRILRDALARLNEGGLLVVEVGNSAAALEQAYPELPFTWVEFERGGHGVFVLSRAELAAHRDVLV